MTTRQVYVTFLSLIVLAVVIGKIVLSWHGEGQQEGLIAIGAVAIGALATLALVADRPEKPAPRPIPPPTPPPPPSPEEATAVTQGAWPRREDD